MIKKRKSIFNVIFIRIITVVLFFNLLLAGWQIRETRSLQSENIDKYKEKALNEISGIVKSWDSVLKTLENVFSRIQKDAMEIVSDQYFKHDLKNVNLSQMLILQGLDPDFFDYYVIEDGVVINTTFPADSGLNLYDFGEEHKKFLLSVIEGGEPVFEKFTLEYSTGRLKAYSYLPTSDKKYIIELGCYSETADELLDMFEQRLSSLIQENENITSVNFWFGQEHPIGFLEDENRNPFLDTLILESFEKKTEAAGAYFNNNRTYGIVCRYIELEIEYPFNSIVISLVVDITDWQQQINNIIKRQLVYILIYISLFVLILILATRKFKTTISDLLKKTSSIAEGALSERVIVSGNNELTTLSEHFNFMVESLENSQTELLQKNDVIEKNNEALQDQNDEIIAQRDELEKQRDIVSEQNKEITDSINYAKRIQSAVLPSDKYLKELLPEHFLLFKPRDIVSGDFYWIKQIKNFTVVVAADCTGHGVPGAFMSMLGVSMLNEIVGKSRLDSAGVFLDRLRKKVKSTLSQEGKELEQKDGMDLSLAILDSDNNEMQYAGAFNPIYLIRQNQTSAEGEMSDFLSMEMGEIKLYEIKGDRQPISIYSQEKEFKTNYIKLLSGDALYMFSDGYSDQMGGPRDKKFMVKKFKELLLGIQDEPMNVQKKILDTTLEEWKGDIKQIDDILVFGIKWR